MIGDSYEFEAVLFEWDARREKWVFAPLPADVSAEIRDQPRPPAGFESVRVEVRIGDSLWKTSIFPNSSGLYVVPIKKAIRQKYGIDTGDTVTIGVTLLV